MDSSDENSLHSTPSLRAHPEATKTNVDTHFRLDTPPSQSQEHPQESLPASAESPPDFHSHGFPALYFPQPSSAEPYPNLVTAACAPDSLAAFAPAPPFEESFGSPSTVVAETKAALPRDTKQGQSSKDLDDGEPPPPYTEGSSPLEGFTYVMAAAGGAASILTQVQQGGPAPINTSLQGGMSRWDSCHAIIVDDEVQAPTRTSLWNCGLCRPRI